MVSVYASQHGIPFQIFLALFNALAWTTMDFLISHVFYSPLHPSVPFQCVPTINQHCFGRLFLLKPPLPSRPHFPLPVLAQNHICYVTCHTRSQESTPYSWQSLHSCAPPQVCARRNPIENIMGAISLLVWLWKYRYSIIAFPVSFKLFGWFGLFYYLVYFLSSNAATTISPSVACWTQSLLPGENWWSSIVKWNRHG